MLSEYNLGSMLILNVIPDFSRKAGHASYFQPGYGIFGPGSGYTFIFSNLGTFAFFSTFVLCTQCTLVLSGIFHTWCMVRDYFYF